jgi:MYXO-CTERM domain-containing protein
MKNINTILAVGAVAAVCGAAEAGMSFSGTYTFASGTQTNLSPMAYNGASITNVTPSSIAVAGATWSSSGGNFRATNWALDGLPVGGLTGQIDLTKYIAFTLTADAGFAIDMTSITFGLGRSATGVRQWQWRSSLDNFASALTNYTTLNAGLTNTAGVLQNPDANSNWTGNTLTVSGAGFSGLSSVEFRLYGYNSEATTGTGGLQGPLTFTGTVSAVPAPGAVALLGVAGLLGARRRR